MKTNNVAPSSTPQGDSSCNQFLLTVISAFCSRVLNNRSIQTLFFLMMVLGPVKFSAQEIYNGDFEFSTSCDPEDCDDVEISCIDGWWSYDNTDPDLFAWYKYNLCDENRSPTTNCEFSSLGERGLWLQSSTFSDVPRNPIRAATHNPYFGDNLNAVYKIQFDFIPFTSSPPQTEAYVSVFGTNTIAQGSVTHLKTTLYPVSGCETMTLFFDHGTIQDPLPMIAGFRFLVFAVTYSAGAPGGSPPPSPQPQTRGVIDNVSMCKVLEVIVQDDCEPTCVSVDYHPSCFDADCNTAECSTQLIVYYDQFTTFIDYDEPLGWIDFSECAEISDEYEEVQVTFLAQHEDFPDGFNIRFSYETNDCEDFIVDSNLSWDTGNVPNEGKFRNVVIESGFVLTIEEDLELHFCQGGSLIVEPGARLELYGKLSSNCPTGWEGVKVYGNPNYNQFFDKNIQGYRQGRMFMYPGSLIENALTAVQLYGPDTDDAGGQLFADGAVFLNNSRGVVFYPYTNFVLLGGVQSKPRPYESLISDCDFVVDDQYILDRTFRTHIQMISVDDVPILGSDFLNSMTLPDATNLFQYGMAIHAVGAGFRVDDLPCPEPCEEEKQSSFNGFGSAISSYRIFDNKPFVVNHAVFQHNYYGISTLSVSGATITNNSFLFDHVPNTDIRNDQIGVHLQGDIFMLNIQENHFTHSGGTIDNSLGIITEALGLRNLAVRRNYFTGMTIGNEAFGINANNGVFPYVGLHYLCNQNLDGAEYDFYIPEESYYDKNIIRKDQKDIVFDGPFPGNGAAGNTFSLIGGTYSDFANFGDDGIDYYYNSLGTDEEPEDYFGIDHLIDATPNPCFNLLCPMPCFSSGEIASEKTAFFNNLILLDDAISEEDTLLAQYYRMILDSNLTNILEFIMYDTSTIGGKDSLRLWLTRSESMAGDLWIAGDLMTTGSYSAADDMLDSILVRYDITSGQSEDIERIRGVYDILSGRSFLDLDSLSIEQMVDTANLFGTSASIARSVLSCYDILYTPSYYIPGEIYPRSVSKPTGKEKVKSNGIRIYPNPASDHIIFRLDDWTGSNSILFVYDLTGRELLSQQVVQGINEISVQRFSPGLLFYSLRENDRIILRGSFLKM